MRINKKALPRLVIGLITVSFFFASRSLIKAQETIISDTFALNGATRTAGSLLSNSTPELGSGTWKASSSSIFSSSAKITTATNEQNIVGEVAFLGESSEKSFIPTQVHRSPQLTYLINFSSSGTYYLWVDGRNDDSNSTAAAGVHLGLDGAVGANAIDINNFTSTFSWKNGRTSPQKASLTVTTSGVHTVNVWVSQSGIRIKQLFFSTDPNPALPPP